MKINLQPSQPDVSAPHRPHLWRNSQSQTILLLRISELSRHTFNPSKKSISIPPIIKGTKTNCLTSTTQNYRKSKTKSVGGRSFLLEYVKGFWFYGFDNSWAKHYLPRIGTDLASHRPDGKALYRSCFGRPIGHKNKDLQVIKFMTYRCLNLPSAGGLNLGMPKQPLLSLILVVTDDQCLPSLKTKLGYQWR